VKVYPGVGHSFMNNHPGKLATFAGAAGKDAALPRARKRVSSAGQSFRPWASAAVTSPMTCRVRCSSAIRSLGE
jgi:hypothetical protein